MRRVFPLAGLLLLPLSLAALSATAQTTDAPRARIQLDANRDGAIDRAEAAKHPRLAGHFDRLDRNQDGRLTRDERGQRHGLHHRGGKRHHGGIARLDTDKDGRISRAEFAAMETRMAEWKARHAERAGKADPNDHRAPMDFAAIDANRDGYLVRAELRAYHERLRPQREAARKARIDAKFGSVDLNKDGRLGRVEVEQAMPRLAERFNWMDDNRDGFLDRGELASGRGHRR
jgi:Ca2+-binding EF-hand superfamily protein